MVGAGREVNGIGIHQTHLPNFPAPLSIFTLRLWVFVIKDSFHLLTGFALKSLFHLLCVKHLHDPTHFLSSRYLSKKSGSIET